jgi:hypothetical protein
LFWNDLVYGIIFLFFSSIWKSLLQAKVFLWSRILFCAKYLEVQTYLASKWRCVKRKEKLSHIPNHFKTKTNHVIANRYFLRWPNACVSIYPRKSLDNSTMMSQQLPLLFCAKYLEVQTYLASKWRCVGRVHGDFLFFNQLTLSSLLKEIKTFLNC